MKVNRPPDTEQRLSAITTPHHAFVWAGAGTGKTHTLTLRALYLILNAPFLSAQPNFKWIYSSGDRRQRPQAARLTLQSLALTTFTKNAAAEMQNRVQGYLDLLASAHTPSELAGKSWKRILANFLQWVETVGVGELGFVTFDETIRLAVRLLKNHPQVRSWERERLRAILVDEFQDTDPDQLELVRLLLGKDDASGEEVLGFFVGDFKQSIYRFRGVDLAGLQHFRQHYASHTGSTFPLQDFRLSTTFRSLPPVIKFINAFFSQQIHLAQPEEELQPYRQERGRIHCGILPRSCHAETGPSPSSRRLGNRPQDRRFEG